MTGQMMVMPGGPVMVVPGAEQKQAAAATQQAVAEGRSREPFRTLHPPPGDDRGAHGVGDPVWRDGVQASAGERPAGGGLPGHPGAGGYPGATPETVANNVATPLERQFMQIPGLELVTSRASRGTERSRCSSTLDKSIDAAATDVQAAISQATGQLPPDLPSPPTFYQDESERSADHVHRAGQRHDDQAVSCTTMANTQVGAADQHPAGREPGAGVRHASRRSGSRPIRRRSRRAALTMDDLADGDPQRHELSGCRAVRRPEPHIPAPAAGAARERRAVQQPDHRARATGRRST